MSQPQGTAQEESPREFMERLGVNFSNLALLTRALTHRSYLNEHPEALEDNERLEFLGDAVLDFLVGSWLYHRYPEMAEGELTQMRTALVRTEQLADFAEQVDLGRALRLGQGEIKSGGRQRPGLLCGAFEALVGGLYLDSGIERVSEFMEPFLEDAVRMILENGHPRDPKSLLQEWTQARGMPPPDYQTVAESGPDHAKEFTVQVVIEGEVISQGTGCSKREAAKLAARDAYQDLAG
jgi:ribonuclease-3